MLAAPIIQGTLPAFYKEDNGTVKLTVPFSMSRAVHSSQIIGFNVKVKNIQGTSYLVSGFSDQIDYANSTVTFKLTSSAEKARITSAIDELFEEMDQTLQQAKETYYTEMEQASLLEDPIEREQAEIAAGKKLDSALQDYANGKQALQNNIASGYSQLKSTLDTYEAQGVWDPVPSTFYKVQIAYVDQSGVVGHYSTVGVAKCTTRPNVSIYGLDPAATNGHIFTYTGLYDQINEEQDKTEKVFAYRFTLENKNGDLIKDTGYVTHNSSNDTSGHESYDVFDYSYELPIGEKFYLTYWIKTMNNLEISSPVYTLMQKRSVPANAKIALRAKMNSENACIDLSLQGELDKNGDEKPVRGSFVIMRASDKSDYKNWERIVEFDLASDPPSSRTWSDFTIEQGVFYKYSLQQYNSTIYSEKVLIEEPIYADFEYSYLFDGKRQLKIKFNPKMTSLKKDLLESKVDTIGSKFPFIFRNGQVEYKEFPISGLISYRSDEQGKFIECDNFEYNQHRKEERKYRTISFPEDLLRSSIAQREFEKKYLKDYRFYFILVGVDAYSKWTTYLNENYPSLDVTDWESVKDVFLLNLFKLYFQTSVNQNVFSDQQLAAVEDNQAYETARERIFKTEVFEWLTNGKPKLFKSSTEGNFLVRLMNVNLTPMDQVGRMLHTFNCTAYEIADMTYKSLVELGFINIKELKKEVLKVTTIPFYTMDENYAKLNAPLYVKNGEGYFAMGNLLQRVGKVERFVLEDVPFGTEFIIDEQSIKMGSNSYWSGNIPTEQIILKSPTQLAYGQLTVYYYEEGVDTPFSYIKDVQVRDIFAKQVIGEHKSVELDLENIEKSVGYYYDVKFIKRHIEETVPRLEDGIYTLGSPEGKSIVKVKFPSSNKTTTLDVSTENCDIPFNPLYGYGFSVDSDPWMGGLFMPVVYLNISKQDLGNETERDLALRTATNVAIQNYPDDFENDILNGRLYEYTYKDNKWDFYPLTANNTAELETHKSSFLIDRFYAYKQPIEYVLVPEAPKQIYLTPSCYSMAEKMYTSMEKKSGATQLLSKFASIYRPFSPNVRMNGGDILLQNVDSLSTGEVDEVHGLDLGPGVYCELYYQEQRTIYDVSRHANTLNAQQIIDNYYHSLSKTQMIDYCITSERTEEYAKKLGYIYTNFHSHYDNYLTYLALYLNSISQGKIQ